MSLVRAGELGRAGPEIGHCLAGFAQRLNPARAGLVAWRHQLMRWGLQMPEDEFAFGRVWRVVINDVGRQKIERTLPSGGRIRVFEDGLACTRKRHGDGKVEGPHYVLSFVDAEALWRDINCSVLPVPCETERLDLRVYTRSAEAV